jgi:immediate early response 3-interacting protein 1
VPYIFYTRESKVGLLGLNSVMILNKQRFLSKHGLDDLVAASGDPVKSQIVGLLHAVAYLKMPVIAANIITIIFEIFFGG